MRILFLILYLLLLGTNRIVLAEETTHQQLPSIPSVEVKPHTDSNEEKLDAPAAQNQPKPPEMTEALAPVPIPVSSPVPSSEQKPEELSKDPGTAPPAEPTLPEKPEAAPAPKAPPIDYHKKIDQLIQEIKIEIERIIARSEEEEEEIESLVVPEETIQGTETKPNLETNWGSEKKESNLLATNKGLKMGGYEIITPEEKKEELKFQ